MPQNQINVPLVLQSLADEHSYRLFKRVAAADLHYGDLREASSELTKKQYYSRLSRLIDVGLIARRDGIYSLTGFGKTILSCTSQMEQAVANVWKFKALDSIENFGGLSEEEQQKIADSLLGKSSLAASLLEDKVVNEAKH